MKVKDILIEVEPQWIKNTRYDDIQPKVTVVLPTFSRGKSGYFEKAVESILKQRYENWELIIVDDASTDGTSDLIKFYMDIDKRVNCIQHTFNLGLPAISEYEAYMEARGEYIAYMFDDNVWDEEHLYLSMKAMIKYNAKFTYGITRSFDADMNYADLCFDLHLLPICNCIGNGSVVLHKTVIETVGLYDPHISVTRNCDWDLWRRVYKVFYMHKIDLIVTSEYGVGLKDSLGNTVEMNVWASLEQIASTRSDTLLPSCFENYDIVRTSQESTPLFYQFVYNYYQKYRHKKWYREIVQSNNLQQYTTLKRILLVAPSLEATYSLAFEALESQAIFKVILFSMLSERELPYVDTIIYMRNSVLSLQFARKFETYNIPSFYYFDDNFIELYKDDKIKKESRDYETIKLWSESLINKDMHVFHKIIVSTEALKKYCIKKEIHRQIQVLPPCKECNTNISALDLKVSLTIGFMGGEFREGAFIKNVYPDIKCLAENIKVRLICPSTLSQKIIYIYKDQLNIELVGIERMISYNQMMATYKLHGINILIHSGDGIKNNQYKTKNALINAVELGAVLIASDIEPYKNELAILTCKDNKGWYSHIKKIYEDKGFYEEQYDRQKQFVHKNYSQKVVSKIFEDIIKEVKEISIPMILNRYDKVLEHGVERKLLIQQELNFIDRLLSFSKFIKPSNCYHIKDDFEQFSKLGVIFSSDDNLIDGRIIVRIYDKNNHLLAQSSLNMKDIVYRQISYFNFGLNIKVNSKVKINFESEYSLENRGCIGIYESKAKRNILYRVLKKLTGFKLPIVNLLYYDLQ